jgi:serine/threonine protein kinase
VKEFLGEGTFGEVYSVEHLTTKEIMAMKAIKIPRKSKGEYDNSVKVMEREFSTGMRLGPLSPFLLKLSNFYVDERYFYIVMEFCSGGDLQKIFNNKNKLPKKVCE